MTDDTLLDTTLTNAAHIEKQGPPQLLVLEGARPGLVMDLIDVEFKIGRRPENHLVLYSPRVSKYHARVVRENDQFVVEDCGSSNGIVVNGVRLPPRGRRLLYHGDTIRLPENLLLFRNECNFTAWETMASIVVDFDKVRAEVDQLLESVPEFKQRRSR